MHDGISMEYERQPSPKRAQSSERSYLLAPPLISASWCSKLESYIRVCNANVIPSGLDLTSAQRAHTRSRREFAADDIVPEHGDPLYISNRFYRHDSLVLIHQFAGALRGCGLELFAGCRIVEDGLDIVGDARFMAHWG